MIDEGIIAEWHMFVIAVMLPCMIVRILGMLSAY
jgi:hypothetical protein